MQDATVEQVQAADQEASAQRQEAVAASAPMADEPLSPGSVSALQQAVTRAVDGMSGGQIPAPEFQPVEGPVDQLPPDLFNAVYTVGSFLAEAAPPEIQEKYGFDPIELSKSNAGVDEMGAVLDGIAQDKSVAQFMQAPAAPAQAAEAPQGPKQRSPAEAAEELTRKE